MMRIDFAGLDRRVEQMHFEIAEAHIDFFHLAGLLLFFRWVDFFHNLSTDHLGVATSMSINYNQIAPEVSIVMPCLNEAETLAICIAKASQALSSNNIAGEIIVADNGSSDGS